MKEPMWRFPEAIDLIVRVQPTAHANGYHLGLAGGVLNKGQSDKDLDVMIMPLNNVEQARDLNTIVEMFCREIGAKNVLTRESGSGSGGSERTVSTDLIILVSDTKKIDLFITRE